MQSRAALTAIGLAVRDLAVARSGRPLLAGLSFTVAPGTALAIMGENGVGKSTLLRALAGLLKPTAGTAGLRLADAGRDAAANTSTRGRSDPHVTSETPAFSPLPCGEGDARTVSMHDHGSPWAHDGDALSVGERAHYVGHANGQKAALTGAENLRFHERWLGGGGLRPVEALDAVGLPHCADIPVGLLSAGQKRRVALAGLLVAPRPLWLLDEPATALDHGSEAILVRLLRDHLATGGLAVMALHAPLDLPVATLRLGRA